MKIGIDISILPLGGGVASYILNLLEGLKNVKPEYEYRLFFNSIRKADPLIDKKIFNLITTRIPVRLLQFFWLHYSFPPVEWFLGDTDLFHSPAHSPVYALSPPAKKWVVTVHDLFTFKLNYGKTSQERELLILRRMEKKADKVIAVSESTRNDLLEMFPSLESRTVVIQEGVDETIFNGSFSSGVVERYKIKTPYILYLGAADFHKNVHRLIKVFSKLKENIPHSLVLAGKITERYQPLIDLTKDLGIQERTVFTGAIEEADLPAVYERADLFVLPSLYEGFGLVLLEAMASGTPVVASDAASIPEVVGDAAVLFDPRDEDDMYKAVLKVISDKELREEMKDRGKKRARLFSWKKWQRKLCVYMKKLENEYESILGCLLA